MTESVEIEGGFYLIDERQALRDDRQRVLRETGDAIRQACAAPPAFPAALFAVAIRTLADEQGLGPACTSAACRRARACCGKAPDPLCVARFDPAHRTLLAGIRIGLELALARDARNRAAVLSVLEDSVLGRAAATTAD